jgi:hypothetical protein
MSTTVIHFLSEFSRITDFLLGLYLLSLTRHHHPDWSHKRPNQSPPRRHPVAVYPSLYLSIFLSLTEGQHLHGAYFENDT